MELEFEGTQEFLKTELLAVVEAMISSLPATPSHNHGIAVDAGAHVEMSTGSIAARIGAESGGDLILAACSHLTFAQGQEVFTRAQIIESMKNATAYYKGSHVANLTKYLTNLVRSGKLIERSAQTYSLSASARTQLESKIRE